MRIVSRKTLREFWAKHAESAEQLKSWYQEAEKANWRNFNDLKREYPSASILVDNRVVFNIKGNRFRLVVKINFKYKIIWIRFVGTQAEYDKIDATKI